MIDQWTACTSGKGCPQSDIYNEINNVFQENYQKVYNGTKLHTA
jgi:hypothetical protein